MDWDEFSTLLAGLNSETPLGAYIRIRSEKDSKKIKEFSKDERKIYNEWRLRKSKKVKTTVEDGERAIREIFGI